MRNNIENNNSIYDIAILGAGAAGLTASIYARRAGLNSIVIDSSMLTGGQIINTYEIENYPGFWNLSGMDLAKKFKEHADHFELNLKTATVSRVVDEGNTKRVITSEGDIIAKSVIIATGAEHRKLGIKGEIELTGMGVSYCATCDGAFFRDKTTVVIGGGDVAIEDAIFLARTSKKVYLIHRRDELRGAKILQDQLFKLENVEVIWDTIPLEINGKFNVEDIKLKNVKTNEESVLKTDGVFVAVGITPKSEMFIELVDVNDGGYIVTNKRCETSCEGICACGDVRDTPLRQVITAAADGALAVTALQDYISRL